MRKRSEVRKQLAAKVAPEPVHEPAWRALEGDVQLRLYESGKGSLDAVLGRYLQLVEAIAPESRGRKKDQMPDVVSVSADHRFTALATIVGGRIDQDPDVIAFRADHWPDGLPSREDADEWMRNQAEDEPPGQFNMQELALPDLDMIHHALAAGVRWSIGDISELWMSLDARPGCVTFGLGGELDRLRRLVKRWQLPGGSLTGELWPDEMEAATVARIMCGTGLVPKMARAWRERNVNLPAETDAVTLVANVRTPVREVVRLFEEARGLDRRSRDHSMQDKHLLLAVFCEWKRQSRTPWPAAQRKWNEDQPDWAYPEDAKGGPRRFARDARAAWSRVTGDEWTEGTE